MVLTIIFLVLFLAFAGVGIFFSIRLVRTPMIEVNFKKHFLKVGLLSLGAVISFIVASFGLFVFRKTTPNFSQAFQLVLGALLFVSALLIGVNFFILHYYGKRLPEKLDKWMFRSLIISLVVGVVFFFVYTNGIANCFYYPLHNGVSFTEGLVRPNPNDTKPNIAFYAICILSGAILVYFICDHYMYKEYGKHGILESTFFVAFPAGIIGGRIGYVIGNWHEFADGPFWNVFKIWNGGLTILAGAPIGIIVGALWYMWRHKDKSIWVAADIVVPTILIAQALGRWGNFFNCEVSGNPSDIELWKWLPEIIWKNGQYDTYGTFLGNGQLYVPLFFIECCTNLLGYFIIAHVFGKAFKKQLELGDLAFGYIVWYGLTRVIMEPLRSSSYKMGTEGSWSWIWAMIFTIGGALAIALNHLIRTLIRKKRGTYKAKASDKAVGLFGSLFFLTVGLLCIKFGISSINESSNSAVVISGYTTGWMLLVVGISFLTGLIVTVPKFIETHFKKAQ